MGCSVCCGYAGGLAPNPAGCPACGPDYDEHEECGVCGAREYEPCDEWAHDIHDWVRTGKWAPVVCGRCGEAYDSEGCPCGHVEPDPEPHGPGVLDAD